MTIREMLRFVQLYIRWYLWLAADSLGRLPESCYDFLDDYVCPANEDLCWLDDITSDYIL